jgi:predicted flap endonuclease-1-like 5' DNA nuclease
MSSNLTLAVPLIVIGVLLVILGIWLLMRANRKTTIIRDETRGKDVLDDGAARAVRNQALIDAPTAVAQNFGQASANANSNMIAAAGEAADAEAGVSVAPTMGDPVPPPPVPPTVPKTTPKPAPAPAEQADDLNQIKGVGPKLVAMLAEKGITSFAQIAAWTQSDIERVDAELGRFKGRITRDRWVDQAKLLAAGDTAGFAEKFGQNG